MRCDTAGCVLVSYLVMGLTLASTTDRPLQHFILSGNSWIPVRERHRDGRGHVVVYVTCSFEFFCRKTFTDCNSNSISRAGEFENYHTLLSFLFFLFVSLFVPVICVTERIFTVFTDVQLFEVNQAGDGGGQVGQVVIGHAQLLQGLAVEELLWEHKGRGQEQWNIIVCRQKSNRPLVARYKRTESMKSAGGMHHLMLWKSRAI